MDKQTELKQAEKVSQSDSSKLLADVRFKVVKYWDTYPDTVWKDGIGTLEEAKDIVKEARKETNYKYDFYVFDSSGVKRT